MNMKKENRQILKASEMAFKNITIILLCVIIGIVIDKHFNTKPLWIILSSILALSYIVCSIFVLGSKEDEL